MLMNGLECSTAVVLKESTSTAVLSRSTVHVETN